jgi:antitoxin HicB
VIYPIALETDDNGTLLVVCPDLPEVTTFGGDLEDARQRASDAIEEALAARIARREEIPPPSPPRGRRCVTLPPLTSAKVNLYQEARVRGMTKAAIGRLLGWHGPQVDRLFDLRHPSKFEQIDRALRTMGKCLDITVRDVA